MSMLQEFCVGRSKGKSVGAKSALKIGQQCFMELRSLTLHGTYHHLVDAEDFSIPLLRL